MNGEAGEAHAKKTSRGGGGNGRGFVGTGAYWQPLE